MEEEIFKKVEKDKMRKMASNIAHEKADPLCWQVVLTRLHVAKWIITQEDLLEMVKVVNREMKRDRG